MGREPPGEGRHPAAPVEWEFQCVPDSRAKIVHARATPPSAHALKMLDPELASRWGAPGTDLRQGPGSLIGTGADHDEHCIVSLVGASGEEIRSIDLTSLFGSQKARPYAVTFLAGRMYLFITKDRYTLTALNVNPLTGEILGRIDYF